MEVLLSAIKYLLEILGERDREIQRLKNGGSNER